MTGANYMGGKRNAARARTKDSTGRVQKRHFGQQRLAAALCNTREERGKPEKMTLKSVIHQINLAPAQRDAKVKGGLPSTAHTSILCDTSFAHCTALDISKRRKKPSKILRTLDISDPVAYRDAIDRILSIPLSEMIGLPLKGPHAEDGGPGVGLEDDLHLPIDADSQSDVQFQGTSSDISSQTRRSSGSASHLFQLENDSDLDEGGIYDNHLSEEKSQPPSQDHRMVTGHKSPLWSIEVDGLHGSWVDDSGYADMDTADIGNLRGSILTPDLLDPQRYPSPPSNSFPFSFGSNSQGTEEYILNMDSSPPSSPGSFAQLRGGWSPNHDNFLQQSRSSSNSPIGSPAIMHDSPAFFRSHSSIKCSNSQGHVSASGSSAKLCSISQSLYHLCGVEPLPASSLETEHVPTTPEKARKMFCATRASEAVLKSSTAIYNTQHYRPFQTSYPATRTEPVEAHSFNSSPVFSSFGSSDTHDPGLPLDILNDPDPWATIGKILNLETVEEHDNDNIDFTRGREGVGYVRRRLDGTAQTWNPPRSSTIIPRLIKLDSEDEPKETMNDEVEEHLGENTDHRHHQPQCSQSEEGPPPHDHTNPSLVEFAEQNKSLCTSTVAESEMQTESPCIPAALTHRVSPQGVQCSGLYDDEMYGGPCLFGDSDEEDD